MNLLNLRSSILCLTLTALCTLVGCETHNEPSSSTSPSIQQASTRLATTPLTTKPLFSEPIQPTLVESPLEALPVWRQTGGTATLVLMANDPLLRPVPPLLMNRAIQLATSANLGEIQTSGARPTPNPVVFDDMTLDLALRARMFVRVIWVLPLTKPLPFDAFKEQLAASGTFSASEIESFGTENSGCFSGKVRGIPTDVCSIDHLPQVQGPIVLHWEMSFFREVYKDEIRTPMYNLLGEIATKLRKTAWSATAVTLNRSSLGQETTLATRFLADDLERLVKHPELLNAPHPPNDWLLRQRAFYADLLFQRAKSIENAKELVRAHPEQASSHFLLYHFLIKDGYSAASEHLHQSVQLDPIYALEYLDLADWALKKNRGEMALELIERARKGLPDDPFIKLQHAKFLLLSGNNRRALSIVEELQSLPWSSLYYQHIPPQLEEMARQAASVRQQTGRPD